MALLTNIIYVFFCVYWSVGFAKFVLLSVHIREIYLYVLGKEQTPVSPLCNAVHFIFYVYIIFFLCMVLWPMALVKERWHFFRAATKEEVRRALKSSENNM